MSRKQLIYSFIFALILVFIPDLVKALPNRIVELEGKAEIKRKGQTDYQPVFKWDIVNLGDIIRPEAGTKLIIRCSDRKLRKADSGLPSGLLAICPTAKNTDARAGENIFLDLLRGEYTYQTLLLVDRPFLTWAEIPGADSYEVKIKAGEEIVWEKTLQGTSVQYDREPLFPKFFYDLEVKAIGIDKPPYQIKVRLVDPAIADIVKAKVNEINKEDISEEAKILVLVEYYLQEQESIASGFLFDALLPLEQLVGNGDKTPVIHRLLGDIYLKLGRSTEAKESYQTAISLAEPIGNLTQIAEAQLGLAHVAVSEGNLSEGKEWLTKVRDTYGLIANKERLDLIQGWLSELEKN